MASTTTKEIALEIPNIIKHYKDGTVERLFSSPYAPPSLHDPQTKVASKDIIISQNNPNSLSARLYLPHNNTYNQKNKLPIFIYFHGGAFICESAFSFPYHRYLNHLVSVADVIAVSVEYRLAPESPLPAAYEDGWEALQWVASHSFINDEECTTHKEPWVVDFGDLTRVYIGGDSAGGNLAHNVAMRAGIETLHGGMKIKGAILSHSGFSGSKPIGSEPICEDIENSMIHRLWGFRYPSNNEGLDNPNINPMAEGAPSLARLGCSKLLVCIASKDMVRDRNVRYYEMVKESGWEGEVELFEVEDEDHCFHIYFEIESENVKKMIKRLADFLV